MLDSIVSYLWNLLHISYYAEISPEFVNDTTTSEKGSIISYCLEVTKVGYVFEAFINDALINLLVLNINACF